MMEKNNSRAIIVIMAIVAVAIGAVLLWLGRQSAEAGNDRQQSFKTAGDYVDAPAMLNLVETLSSDALGGRAACSAGNIAARGFVRKRFEQLELKPVGERYEHGFPILKDGVLKCEGVNLIGQIDGRSSDGPAMIITAHYDHVGIIDDEIYNGADDNASGVAAMIAIAEYFTRNGATHTLIFAALDAEEIGLLGARAMVRSGRLDMDRIALNLNLDMVSRSDVGELYASGTSHSPALFPFVEALAADAPITLLTGHDTPREGEPFYDWTELSDHAVFHEAGVPFIYFGVEDHADYHKPGDDYNQITKEFFVDAANTLVMATKRFDEKLAIIAALE